MATHSLEQIIEACWPGIICPQHIGISCGRGWWPLLWGVCHHIHYFNKYLSPPEPIQIQQIKEKFGTLRIYIGGVPVESEAQRLASEKLWALLDTAEAASGLTCENCGNPGAATYLGDWVQTLCPSCIVVKKQPTMGDASKDAAG